MRRSRLLLALLFLALAAACLPTDVCGCEPAWPERISAFVKDGGDPDPVAGVAGATVELLDASSTVLETVVTDSTGWVSFETRTPYGAPFLVRLTPPDDWQLSAGQANPASVTVEMYAPPELVFTLERR